MDQGKKGPPVIQPMPEPPPEVLKAAIELVTFAYNQSFEVHMLALSDLKAGNQPMGSWEISIRKVD